MGLSAPIICVNSYLLRPVAQMATSVVPRLVIRSSAVFTSSLIEFMGVISYFTGNSPSASIYCSRRGGWIETHTHS